MRNQNKKIKDIDERPKTRNEIEKMIKDMFDTDEDGNPEKAEKETA